jgi:hypothetical protein
MVNRKLVLRSAIGGLSTIAISAFSLPAQATQFVLNGGFELSTNGAGQLGSYTNLIGWDSGDGIGSDYNFLYAPGTGDIGGSYSDRHNGYSTLWSNKNGGFGDMPDTSPVGGNFISADGDVDLRHSISQQLNGLIAGQQYVVSFWEAAAQNESIYGDTTERWQVSLGSDTQLSTLFSNPSQSFSGWQQKSLTFTANASSEMLSFLALGSPQGKPPTVLLDGVSVVGPSVPEPFTIVGTMVGLGLGARLKSKLNKKK